MSEGTVTLFVCAAVAIAIGAALFPAYRRHGVRMAKARVAGEFVPRIDARGVWLLLNGPVTLALGLAALAAGAWQAKADLDEKRRVEELLGIDVRCVPDHVTFELLGREARRVDVRLAVALLESGLEGSTVRLAPGGALALAPGTPRTLDAHLVDRGACGTSSAYFGPPDPRSAWPDCDGIRFTLVIRDPHGDALATGERECRLPGRVRTLSLPDFQ